MKGSIIIVSFFVAGVLLGRLVDVPALLTAEEPTLYALCTYVSRGHQHWK